MGIFHWPYVYFATVGADGCVLAFLLCRKREMPEKADDLSAVCVCANTNEILYKNLRPTRAKLALAVFGLSLVSLVLALHTLCAAQTQVHYSIYLACSLAFCAERFRNLGHFVARSEFAILLHVANRVYIASFAARDVRFALLCAPRLTHSVAVGNSRFIYSSVDEQGGIPYVLFSRS